MLMLNEPGCDNVIRLIGTFKNDKCVYLLYEFAEGGELWEQTSFCGIVDMGYAQGCMLQVIEGLEYIHSKNLVHRDLKCENLLVKDGIIKIADLGSSLLIHQAEAESHIAAAPPQQVPYNRKEFKHFVGTPAFMPPEAIENRDSGKLRDLWSLGCLFYQLLVGRPCFYASTDYWTFSRIKGRELEFPPDMDPLAMDLISNLLQIDPERRLGASGGFDKIRNHEFFKIAIQTQITNAFVKNVKRSCTRIGMAILKSENKTPSEKFACMLQEIKDETLTTSRDELRVLKTLIKKMSWFQSTTEEQLAKEAKLTQELLYE
ncbi:bifunctional Protein kinase-like domain superfamily/Protein kinase domain/Serine-threonine-protein kinase [Babesia duncani]|nr:bifunctional Protein kinase-like domain superfamily/Protein kinase domain/Serine-threonine-protein kinase [Babesia duncani]